MDIQSTIYLQIVADVVLCLAIIVLLLRLGKNTNKNRVTVIDEQSLLQFRKLLAESQIDAERIHNTIDEGYRKFKELATDLEVREERLKVLLKEMNRHTKTFDITEHAGDELAYKKKHETIMQYLEEGVPMEEIAERTGITAGEILLIADLERVKKVNQISK
jgi:hypothetical protein